MDRIFNPMIRAMRELPKPIVGAINGVAAGGGANFALACDIVLAARSARFDQAFVRISLMPDLGGTWFLPRTVGDARARGLAMLGKSVPAEEAERMGMIWQTVDDDALMDEATKLARQLAGGPTLSYAAIKQAINAAATNTLDQQLDLERDSQRALGRSADFKEGVSAFLAKRPAAVHADAEDDELQHHHRRQRPGPGHADAERARQAQRRVAQDDRRAEGLLGGRSPPTARCAPCC